MNVYRSERRRRSIHSQYHRENRVETHTRAGISLINWGQSMCVLRSEFFKAARNGERRGGGAPSPRQPAQLPHAAGC